LELAGKDWEAHLGWKMDRLCTLEKASTVKSFAVISIVVIWRMAISEQTVF